MRTVSTLLALVVVLGFVREAPAAGQLGRHTDVPNDTDSNFKPYIEIPTPPLHAYTLTIGGHLFGFRDWVYGSSGPSYAYLGPPTRKSRSPLHRDPRACRVLPDRGRTDCVDGTLDGAVEKKCRNCMNQISPNDVCPCCNIEVTGRMDGVKCGETSC
jgi:hypothetical protein